MLIELFVIIALNCHYNTLLMLHCHHSGSEVNSQQMKISESCCVESDRGQKVKGAGLLYLTGGGGGDLAAHAGRVD